MNLFGLEAELLLKLASGEQIVTMNKASRDAKKRLEERGLIEKESLTELGKAEAQWRTAIIERARDIYDLKPGGGYRRDIHLVFEPIQAFSYAYNWCGLHGVSIIKTDPRKGTTFFEIGDTKFWLEGNPLSTD